MRKEEYRSTATISLGAFVSILAERRTYVAGRWITGDDVVERRKSRG